MTATTLVATKQDSNLAERINLIAGPREIVQC